MTSILSVKQVWYRINFDNKVDTKSNVDNKKVSNFVSNQKEQGSGTAVTKLQINIIQS